MTSPQSNSESNVIQVSRMDKVCLLPLPSHYRLFRKLLEELEVPLGLHVKWRKSLYDSLDYYLDDNLKPSIAAQLTFCVWMSNGLFWIYFFQRQTLLAFWAIWRCLNPEKIYHSTSTKHIVHVNREVLLNNQCQSCKVASSNSIFSSFLLRIYIIYIVNHSGVLILFFIPILPFLRTDIAVGLYPVTITFTFLRLQMKVQIGWHRR